MNTTRPEPGRGWTGEPDGGSSGVVDRKPLLPPRLHVAHTGMSSGPVWHAALQSDDAVAWYRLGTITRSPRYGGGVIAVPASCADDGPPSNGDLRGEDSLFTIIGAGDCRVGDGTRGLGAEIADTSGPAAGDSERCACGVGGAFLDNVDSVGDIEPAREAGDRATDRTDGDFGKVGGWDFPRGVDTAGDCVRRDTARGSSGSTSSSSVSVENDKKESRRAGDAASSFDSEGTLYGCSCTRKLCVRTGAASGFLLSFSSKRALLAITAVMGLPFRACSIPRPVTSCLLRAVALTDDARRWPSLRGVATLGDEFHLGCSTFGEGTAGIRPRPVRVWIERPLDALREGLLSLIVSSALQTAVMTTARRLDWVFLEKTGERAPKHRR